MDRLASMAAFVRTVESGSFAATASTLGISPQMVAKHVAYLEARLGTRLLNRTTRKQSLTEIGRTYYDRLQGRFGGGSTGRTRLPMGRRGGREAVCGSTRQ